MVCDQRSQRRWQFLDVANRLVPDEVEGEMNPLHRVQPQPVFERLQFRLSRLQLPPKGLRQLNGEKDPPAFGISDRRGCRP